jgi:hypothetical protein
MQQHKDIYVCYKKVSLKEWPVSYLEIQVEVFLRG